MFKKVFITAAAAAAVSVPLAGAAWADPTTNPPPGPGGVPGDGPSPGSLFSYVAFVGGI